MRILLISAIASICGIFSYQNVAEGYSPSVHKELTIYLIEKNKEDINGYLNSIGISGVGEIINNKAIREWLEEGSVKEDYTWDILVSHFYNPLTNEGIGKSAYERANDVWKRARESYYTGLTSAGSQREEALASSFEYLGRVMHLVQDMGVAAHTRRLS